MFSPLLLSPSYGLHYPRSTCNFSNTPDFAARPFTFTPEPRYGTHYFSPSTLTPSLHRRNNLQGNIFPDGKMFSTSTSCCMLPASLKTKLAFVTSMARGGMLRVSIPGGECARFDAVILDAYKECPVLDQEDRRRYL